jgi:hypothetical protein
MAADENASVVTAPQIAAIRRNAIGTPGLVGLFSLLVPGISSGDGGRAYEITPII